MRALLLLLFFSFGLFGTVMGQGSLAEKKRHAKELFLSAHYQEAYYLLQSSGDSRQADAETNFLMALCLYQLNQLDAAENILLNLISTKSGYTESWLYLARIYHDRHEFLKATEYYKAYLKVLSPNAPNRSAVREAIRRCSNGIQWQYRKPLAIVENLGSEVNTAFDEFGPIVSPTSNERLYFSSARPGCSGGPRNSNGQPDELYGRYTCDIFFTQLQNGQWKSPSGISYLVNTPKHEIVFGFGKNGSAMYYFKGTNFSQGQVFIDSFRVGTTNILSSDILYSPIDPISGISAPFFVSDTVVIFPSQRPGGYGGLDLYRSVFSQGYWSAPQNLGSEINSPYDDTTPFMARDGKSLYYSTNNPEYSLGGFDVVKTVFNPYAGRWSPPVNLGLPINSAGDETHFYLSKDGYTAFFASSRKDGYGERDLYAAYFLDFLPEMGQSNRSGAHSSPAAYTLYSQGNNTLYPVSADFFPNYNKVEHP